MNIPIYICWIVIIPKSDKHVKNQKFYIQYSVLKKKIPKIKFVFLICDTF